jgi:hypothetical protein
LNGLVQASGGQVRLDTAIERARACVFIEPQAQFLQLFLGQGSNGALEFFDFFFRSCPAPASDATYEIRL